MTGEEYHGEVVGPGLGDRLYCALDAVAAHVFAEKHRFVYIVKCILVALDESIHDGLCVGFIILQSMKVWRSVVVKTDGQNVERRRFAQTCGLVVDKRSVVHLAGFIDHGDLAVTGRQLYAEFAGQQGRRGDVARFRSRCGKSPSASLSQK